MNFVKAIFLLEWQESFSKTTGDIPKFLIEVLGKTTLERMVENLRAAGFGDVVLVADRELAYSRLARSHAAGATIVDAPASQLWRIAEQQFEELGDDATHLVIAKLDAYVELNWDDLLEHHRKHGNKITRIEYRGESLNLCLANSSRRKDAANLLRNGTHSEADGVPYIAGKNGDEYVNFLRHEADLRKLASDALHHNCKMQPAGTEIRPGIWAAKDSRIEKGARLVAPIFIGSRACVCPGAVITRGSSIERHAVIGNKTVVENGTVLPYTNLGPGLDVSHSLVGERHIFNLQRNVCTPIQDPRLVSQISASAGMRTASSLAKLLLHIPGQIWRGTRSKAPVPAAESTVSYKEVFDSAKTQSIEMPKVSGMAVVRRYGNQ